MLFIFVPKKSSDFVTNIKLQCKRCDNYRFNGYCKGFNLFKVTELSMEGCVICTRNLRAKTILFYISKINCIAAKIMNPCTTTPCN